MCSKMEYTSYTLNGQSLLVRLNSGKLPLQLDLRRPYVVYTSVAHADLPNVRDAIAVWVRIEVAALPFNVQISAIGIHYKLRRGRTKLAFVETRNGFVSLR